MNIVDLSECTDLICSFGKLRILHIRNFDKAGRWILSCVRSTCFSSAVLIADLVTITFVAFFGLIGTHIITYDVWLNDC